MKETKPIIKQGWLRAILFTITFLIVLIFSNIAIDRFAGNQQTGQATTDSVSFFLLRVFISSVMSILTVYFFIRLVDKRDLRSLGLDFKNNSFHAATGLLLGLVLLGIGTLLLVLTNNLQWIAIHVEAGQLLTGLVVMAMVAFSEELVVRGYILNNLLASMNKWLALLSSAVIFSLFHFNNPGADIFALVNVFLAGLLLGVNYIFTRNLWFGICFHFAWNFYQGSVLGYKVSGLSLKSVFEQQLSGSPLLTGGAFGFEGSAIAALLLLLALLSLGWLYQKRQSTT